MVKIGDGSKRNVWRQMSHFGGEAVVGCSVCKKEIEESLEGTYNGKCTTCFAKELGSSGLSITVGCEIKEIIVVP